MKKRVVYMLLCFMLCMASIPAAAFADSETPAVRPTKWSDNAATAFAGGSGTEADPYQIETAEQLAKLSKDVAGGEKYTGKYFRLEKNLDLSAHCWTPIGLYRWKDSGDVVNKSFGGYFDGNDKKISGMIVDQRSDQYCGGLFGNIVCSSGDVNCGVVDLTIVDGIVYNNAAGLTETNNGILVGFVMTNEGCSVEFSGITISGGTIKIEGWPVSGRVAGGMLGNVNRVKVSACEVENIDISGVDNAGGFVGMDSGSTYKNCTASGKVSGYWALGGFVGYTMTNGSMIPTFDHCLADVNITAEDWRAGGFIGMGGNEDGCSVKITHCVAAGDVNSTVTEWEPKAGTFAGELYNSTIEASHAAGKVTSANEEYKAGGFTGVNSGSTFTGSSFDVEKNADLKAAGGTEAAEIEGIEAALTQKVKANVCRDYYGKHELKEVPGKAANCLEDGVETYWMCGNCGSMYSDKEQMTMITEPVVIKATGHKFGEWKVIKEATASEKGEKQRTCQVCQFVEKAEIPATGAPVNDKSAATGDSSMPILYGILALAALAGAGAVIVTRKKRMN